MGARWSGDAAAPSGASGAAADDTKYKESITQAGADGIKGTSLFSKDSLEFSFGSGTDAEGGEGSDEIVITNHKAMKVKYKIEAAPSTQCVIHANPATGSIAPGKDKKVKLKADVKDKVNLNFKLTVMIGTEAHFLNVRVRSVTGVFGTDPTTLELVEDEDLMVPEVLSLMKRSLINADGLKSEGIFRLAGDVADIAQLKDQMNKKIFQKSDNVNTVATLIKVWFRELPEPILNKVPTESIFYSSDQEKCIAAYIDMAEPFKTLLTWLLDLLCMTTQYSSINRMTPQNLAIVVAPNLYDTSSSDPMEGLVMSQKCVQFLNNILLWYMEKKTGSVYEYAPTPAIPIRRDDGGEPAVASSAPSSSPTAPSPAVNSLLLSGDRPRSPGKRKLSRNQTDGDRLAKSSDSVPSDPATSKRGSGSPRSVKRKGSSKEGSSISISGPRARSATSLGSSSGDIPSSSTPPLPETMEAAAPPSLSPAPSPTLSNDSLGHTPSVSSPSLNLALPVSSAPESPKLSSRALPIPTSPHNASPTGTPPMSPSSVGKLSSMPKLPSSPAPKMVLDRRAGSLSVLPIQTVSSSSSSSGPSSPVPGGTPPTSPLPNRQVAASVSSPRAIPSPRSGPSFSISRPSPPPSIAPHSPKNVSETAETPALPDGPVSEAITTPSPSNVPETVEPSALPDGPVLESIATPSPTTVSETVEPPALPEEPVLEKVQAAEAAQSEVVDESLSTLAPDSPLPASAPSDM